MPYEYRITRRVEFHETDMAGIVHFSNYFRYMESAEHAFFRSLELSIDGTEFEVGWPRGGASCEYKAPLRFEDEFEVHLLVTEKKAKSIGYTFIIRKLEAQADGEPTLEVARGRLTVVCVCRDPATGRMSAVNIPPAIAERIDVAPAKLLQLTQQE